MKRINILVDLGNVNPFRGIFRPNPSIVSDRLESLISKIIASLEIYYQDGPWEARIRLYFGWFDSEGKSTDLHMMLFPYIKKAFPTRFKKCRLFVELAEGPASLRGNRINHTFRVEHGLPPYSYSINDALPIRCFSPQDCSILALKHWLKGSCYRRAEGCSVRLSDIVVHEKQKLVDTSIVSDIVWLAGQGEDVAVLSDDEDVIPGLITASCNSVAVLWMCRSGKPRDPYKTIFAQQRIGCLSCLI